MSWAAASDSLLSFFKTMFELFKQDALRWVVQGQIAPASELTMRKLLLLLYRYMSLRAMAWFRFGSWCQHRGIPFLPGFTQRRIHRNYGLEIVVGTDIGGGLYIAHPVGTVIAAKRMGKNCSVISAVTIGMRNEWVFPDIGDNVFIGAGARVLGGIIIGDYAIIGANAVVINDIPAGATAVGIPAKVIRTNPVLMEL
jgi:serine O-acetyltransferase